MFEIRAAGLLQACWLAASFESWCAMTRHASSKACACFLNIFLENGCALGRYMKTHAICKTFVNDLAVAQFAIGICSRPFCSYPKLWLVRSHGQDLALHTQDGSYMYNHYLVVNYPRIVFVA